MRVEQETISKIVRDALISILLYAIPVLLMLLSFKITGQQPWKSKTSNMQVQSK